MPSIIPLLTLNYPLMYPAKRNPLGYKVLRTWQQAKEIFEITEEFTATLPLKHPKTGQYLSDLKDQMIRSGRSQVRNIEEGYCRVSTKEYIEFLGFALGSLEELLSDFEYCVKGQLGDNEGAIKGLRYCRGQFKMLSNQIDKLKEKMISEGQVSSNDRARLILQENTKKEKENDAWVLEQRKKYGSK